MFLCLKLKRNLNKKKWIFLLEEKNELILLFPFYRYLEHIWIEVSWILKKDILKKKNKIDLSREVILFNLKQPLLDLIKRVLVWEFHLGKKNNPNLKLPKFLYLLSNRKELRKLLNKYPVLGRFLEKTIINHKKYLNALFHRLNTDLMEISEVFGLNNNLKLKSLKTLSDSHSLGGRVAELYFTNSNQTIFKKIIYKPKDIRLEKKFNELLCYINEYFSQYPLKTLTILLKNDYGWLEHVEALSLTQAQVEKYYYKFGVLLAICFSMGCRDLHFENLVACGSDPVIVDPECLLSPPISQSQFIDPFFPNIFETSLIPFPSASKKPKYNFSALLNHNNQKSLISHIVVRGDFFNNIYIEREKGNLIPKNNLLICKENNKAVSPFNHAFAITEGFQAFMGWLIENKKKFESFVILNFKNLKSRIILKPTFMYAKIFQESCHPEILSSFNKIYQFMRQIDFDKSLSTSIYYSELHDLLNCDVPFFTINTDKTDIYNSQNIIISRKAICSGLEKVIQKINNLDQNYISEVNKQILASLRDHYAN